MSQAENLLNNLVTAAFGPEEHIVIGEDRCITVPKALKRIAVQYDHNVETVTFDCPRYWDAHDLSTMIVYIMYTLPNDEEGYYIADNVKVDDTNTSLMHFTWTIRREVTAVAGELSFLVCIKKTDENGIETVHWNSETNEDMHISKGKECGEYIASEYPDEINQLLMRQKRVEDLVNSEHFIPDATLTETDEGVEIKIEDLNKTVTAVVKHGESGVYVGSGEMPAHCNIQIDPTGDNYIVDVSEVGQ